MVEKGLEFNNTVFDVFLNEKKQQDRSLSQSLVMGT